MPLRDLYIGSIYPIDAAALSSPRNRTGRAGELLRASRWLILRDGNVALNTTCIASQTSCKQTWNSRTR
jgi:hypothetical protein